MSSSKMKKLTVAASLVFLMTYSPAYAVDTIKVAVAANFGTPLSEIITNFQTDYPDYEVAYTADSTGNLKSAIISGNAPGYDLFLSADTATPQDLYSSYPSTVVGSPFTYAKGSLLLWSSTANGLNVSGGLASPIADNLVIANPTTAPYGAAAATVLAQSPWNITTIPSGYVYTASNIDATYSAVAAGTYKQGFIAKSKVCRFTPPSTYTYTATGNTYSYKEYPYNDGAHPYNRIVQDGIRINHSRTSGQDAALAAFVSYLGGTSGQATISKYCYDLP